MPSMQASQSFEYVSHSTFVIVRLMPAKFMLIVRGALDTRQALSQDQDYVQEPPQGDNGVLLIEC